MLSSALAFFLFSFLVLHPVATSGPPTTVTAISIAAGGEHVEVHCNIKHGAEGRNGTSRVGLFEFADKPCASATSSSSGSRLSDASGRPGGSTSRTRLAAFELFPVKTVAIVWRNLQPQLIRRQIYRLVSTAAPPRSTRRVEGRLTRQFAETGGGRTVGLSESHRV
jgi:hypothetical protein